MSHDLVVGLRRRRQAADDMRRMDCGCTDPWPCRHSDQTTVLSEHQIDAYRAAAQTLLENGLTPAPNVECLRALWRRGGKDRMLVRDISQRWVVAA